MDAPAVIGPEELRQLLRYEADTGKMFWLPRNPDMFRDGYRTKEGNCANWNSAFAGAEAITADSGHGYKVGAIWGRKVYAHRIAWAIARGEQPDVIDHINGDRGDNRLGNLRSVTQRENSRNSAMPRTNKSGHVGVSWIASGNLWRATAAGKHLGCFQSKADAIAARSAADAGSFHENHGRKN